MQGIIKLEENYAYFGKYPQTIKSDDVVITDKIDENGYYFGEDGQRYALLIATPYGTMEKQYSFSNGLDIERGKEYYFKLEPIKWNYIAQENGKAILISDSILFNGRFGIRSSEYSSSLVRNKLNDSFYNSAFSIVEKNAITNNLNEEQDKIALLSRNMLSYLESAQKAPTDYAKALGAFVDIENGVESGEWWINGEGSCANRALCFGNSLTENAVTWLGGGVVPLIQIQ